MAGEGAGAAGDRPTEIPAGLRVEVRADRPEDLHLAPTICHALRHWAQVHPDKNAYTFLPGGDHPPQLISYGELARAAFGIAAQLRRDGLRGERVLVVMHSGLDYILGFLACASAGAIAVPLYPPASERDGAKLAAIVRDCRPKALLFNHGVEASHGAQLSQLPDCRALRVEDLVSAHGFAELASAQAMALDDIAPDDVAFFQYTSGSTGDPKGVIVPHRGIVHNNGMTAKAMGNAINSVIVTWLPLYHDMGLIGMILQSLLVGARTVLMAPKSFVRDPGMWLRAISTYRANCAGAPNFAYDLCNEKVSEATIDGLDLSSLVVAFNGAEPIKAATLDRFHERFARTGFRRDMFFPCYGLAEATLFVAGGPRGHQPTTYDVTHDGPARTLVGMAIDESDQIVRIVDPQTWSVQPDLAVGEIWLKSDSVTRGYWNRTKATADTFHAYTTDTGEGPFMRTGDLGFVRDGSLYITGRIKELIIVNGYNHYPQDIEQTVQALTDDFRVHYGAAFSFEDEKLAVIQAISRGKDLAGRYDELIGQIRRAVLKHHGVAPAYVALVQTGVILKTSSGKIQRGELRRQLLEDRLEVLHAWRAEPARAANGHASGAANGHANGQSNGHANGHSNGHAPGVHAAPAQAIAPSAAPASGAAEAVVEAKLAWIRQYCATRLNSFLIDERRTIPPYVILDFGNQGLLGMQVPAAHGGLGFSTLQFLRVMELLGSKDMTLALFVGLNNVLGVRPVMRYGSARLQQEYLPRLAQGRELAAFSLTEPGAGSNPQAIEAIARPLDGGAAGYQITGTKIWSGSAAWAGLLNVFARNVDANGHPAGISAFAVPQGSPGITQGPEALTMGLRGMVQNQVELDGVVVEPWQVLGELGHGMTVAQDTLCYGRLAIGALCLGATKLCVQLMLDYAGKRKVATGNLLVNPQTRAILTETQHQIAGIEALLGGASERVDAGYDVAPEILAICKSVSTEVLWTTVDRTMQLAGGRGYIEANFIPQLFRDARIFRIFEGPTETLHHFVGTSALRNRPAIRGYLAEALDDRAIAVHYDAVIQALSGQLGAQAAGGRDTALEDWLCLALGAYVEHLVVYAAACGRGAPIATQRWLERRLEAARARVTGAFDGFAALATPDELRALGAGFDHALGRRAPAAAMPNTTLDPMFTPTPAGHATPAAPARTRAPKATPAPPMALRPPAPVAASPVQPADATGSSPHGVAAARKPGADKSEIEAFISQWIARRCAQPVSAIGTNVEFAMLGLGSVDSIDLGAALSEQYALSLDPTVLWSYPNIQELAGFVLGKLTS